MLLTMKSALDKITIISFLFFCYSGLLKWIDISFDPAYIFLAISIFGLIGKLILTPPKIKQQIVSAYLLFILFVAWALASSLYTISSSYYIEKIGKLLIIAYVFLVPVILFKTPSQIKLFIKVFSIFVIFSCIILLYIYYRFEGVEIILYNVSEDDKIPDYLSLSIFIVSGILLFMNRKRFFIICGLIIMVPCLILLGARSPLLLLIGIFVFYALKNAFKKPLYLLLLIGILFGGIYLLSTWQGSERLIDRFSVLGSSSSDNDSALERIKAINTAVEIIIKSTILGIGFGGFGLYYSGFENRMTPHNILLEITSELGIIGLFLFLIFIAQLIVIVRNNKKHFLFYQYSILLIVIFLFLECFFSTFLTDAKALFAWAGIMLASININKQQHAAS